MIKSSKNSIESILRLYTSNIVSGRVILDKDNPDGSEPLEDMFVISEEGRKRMRDRFQSDVINYLRTKY